MFVNHQSMQDTARYIYNTSKDKFSDITVLGNFVNNHDNPRFLQENGNTNAFKNAIAWSLTYPGIGILYYGDEQGYAGGNDPNNREVLWTNLHNTSSEMYEFVTKVVNYRKEIQVWNQDYIERYAQ